MTDAAPPGCAKRSKRLYILWAIALTLLLVAGLFCWKAAVPHLEMKRTEAVVAELNPFKGEGRSLVYTYRTRAETAIEKLGGEAAAAALLDRYLREPRENTISRVTALMILAHCGEPALPVLQRALRDEDDHCRRVAAASLGIMGPEAREAVPALKAMQQDRDQLVRQAATEALEKIEQVREGAQ